METGMIARMVCGLCAIVMFAGTAAASGSTTKSASRNDPDKIVCRLSNDTGSRLGRVRVCKTNAQWAEMRRQTKETIDRIQNNRSANLN
ncbi:MAG: hypothetical protein ACXW2T_02010 [Allosphingosinicella sp.]